MRGILKFNREGGYVLKEKEAQSLRWQGRDWLRESGGEKEEEGDSKRLQKRECVCVYLACLLHK